MAKRSGTVSRRNPSFDALESRCLLSFTGQGVGPLPPHSSDMAGQSRAMFGPNDDLGFPSGLASSTCSIPLSAPSPMASPSSQSSSAFPGGSGPQFQPDSPLPLLAVGAGFPLGSRPPSSPVFQPGNASSPGFVQSPGSASNALLRTRVENVAFTPGDLVQVPAAVSGDFPGPIVGTLVASPITSAVSPVPNQVASLLSLDALATARPESSPDVSAHRDRVADVAGVITTCGTRPNLATSIQRVSALIAEGKLDDFPGLDGDDLMAVVLPFDAASLERAVDHFFQQLDELEVRDLVGTDLTDIVFVSLGLATSAVALEVARRRLRRRTNGGKDVQVRGMLLTGDDLGFPDLPGSWSSRLT
jgi:hypothetical protein